MVKKNILVLFIISISILFFNCYYTFSNYSSIPNEIVTHIDINGNADAFGNKIHLIFAMIANAIFLGVIFFFIKYPKYANYPVEINEQNKDSVYYKMQLFLAVISIITSLVFSYMLFQVLNLSEDIIYVIAYIIIIPILSLIFFKSKSA